MPDRERKCQKHAATHDAYTVATQHSCQESSWVDWNVEVPAGFRYEISDLLKHGLVFFSPRLNPFSQDSYLSTCINSCVC